MIELEIAPFDPTTPKTKPKNQTWSASFSFLLAPAAVCAAVSAGGGVRHLIALLGLTACIVHDADTTLMLQSGSNQIITNRSNEAVLRPSRPRCNPHTSSVMQKPRSLNKFLSREVCVLSSLYMSVAFVWDIRVNTVVCLRCIGVTVKMSKHQL